MKAPGTPILARAEQIESNPVQAINASPALTVSTYFAMMDANETKPPETIKSSQIQSRAAVQYGVEQRHEENERGCNQQFFHYIGERNVRRLP